MFTYLDFAGPIQLKKSNDYMVLLEDHKLYLGTDLNDDDILDILRAGVIVKADC